MDLDEIIQDVMADAMQEVRSALYSAHHAGLTLEEVAAMSRHAQTPMEFIDAVHMLAGTMPDDNYRVT